MFLKLRGLLGLCDVVSVKDKFGFSHIKEAHFTPFGTYIIYTGYYNISGTTYAIELNPDGTLSGNDYFIRWSELYTRPKFESWVMDELRERFKQWAHNNVSS